MQSLTFPVPQPVYASVPSAGDRPVTANDFRTMALALPETEECSHLNHPDSRVCGKIFATLGYPDKSRGMGKAPTRATALLLEGLSRSVRAGEGRSGDAAEPPASISRPPRKKSCAERARFPGLSVMPGLQTFWGGVAPRGFDRELVWVFCALSAASLGVFCGKSVNRRVRKGLATSVTHARILEGRALHPSHN